MLEYTLIENLLTPTPNDYMAQPVNVRSHNLQAIFTRISARYPGLTPAQIASFNRCGMICLIFKISKSYVQPQAVTVSSHRR